jgi:hypothetical protein
LVLQRADEAAERITHRLTSGGPAVEDGSAFKAVSIARPGWTPRGIQGTFTEWAAFITGGADGVGFTMAELFRPSWYEDHR